VDYNSADEREYETSFEDDEDETLPIGPSGEPEVQPEDDDGDD